MDQGDSSLRALVVIPGSGMCTAGFTGYAALRAVSFVAVRPQMLGILAGMEQIDSYAVGRFCLSRCNSRCIPSCCPQAPDACHHGRYGPEGMLRVAVQKTADFPQLQFLAGRRSFLLWCGGRFPWSCCSADHRDSPVAPVHVVDAPGLRFVGFPVVAQWLCLTVQTVVGPRESSVA